MQLYGQVQLTAFEHEVIKMPMVWKIPALFDPGCPALYSCLSQAYSFSITISICPASPNIRTNNQLNYCEEDGSSGFDSDSDGGSSLGSNSSVVGSTSALSNCI